MSTRFLNGDEKWHPVMVILFMVFHQGTAVK